MIKNQWYIVLMSSELKEGKPLGVTRLGEKLVFWRDKNKVNCIKDKCAHRGASLCNGKVVNGEIECPFHAFKFDGSGKCIEIPANGKNTLVPPYFKTNYYLTKEEYGFIWIFYGDKEKASDKLPYFEGLEEFTYHTFKNHWNSHYSRVIENQLDVVHVPFVHKTTIGRGNRTLVNGPVTEIEGTDIIVKVFNTVDDGNPPKSEKELINIEKEQKLIFKFPNLWQNYINSKIRIVIAFTPIDDENTMLYLRYYQSITKLPLLSGLFNRMGSVANYIVMNQDKPIVETQIPKKSEINIGEMLIPGDKPIIEYRKIREKLKNRE